MARMTPKHAAAIYIKGAFVVVMNEQSNSIKMHELNTVKLQFDMV